jgi:hypothetical protein
MSKQRGFTHLFILIAGLGFVVFLLVSRFASFQDKLFSSLFPKPSSYASTSPSNEDMPLGDLAGWKQIFSDDFNTAVPVGSFPQTVANKWMAYPDGWKDTSKNGTYYPSKVISIHDSLMDLYIHSENGIHMVSAPVPILAPGAHDYGSGLPAGRYVVRFKADPIPCYKAAWLLWPDSEVWPRDGEIDFPEGDLTGNIDAFMHRQNGTSGSDQDAYSTNINYTAWHTAITEWRPEIQDLKFYLDGNLIGHSTSRVPNTLMHWVLQTETALSGCIPNNADAGHVLIDWVAVYTPATDSIPSSPTPTPTPIPTLIPTPIATPSINSLTITNIVATSTSSSATISWTTNIPSTSKVLFNTNSNLNQTIEDNTFSTHHQIILPNLSKNTRYYYKTSSKTFDGLMEINSSLLQFKTKNR